MAFEFETGFAANEFELQEKLDAFIRSVDGWTKISQAGDFDSAYFSQGEDGYKDIYIRSVGGLAENPTDFGGNQRDLGDGYVGFLNFFVYQYFPEGGDGYDGYGLAGRYGPLLVWYRGYNTHDMWFQSWSQQGSGSNNNRRWTFTNDISRDPDQSVIEYYNFAGYYAHAIFDGKRSFYFLSQYSLNRWDIGYEGAIVLDRGIQWTHTSMTGNAYTLDPKTRKEYFWWMSQENTSRAFDGTSNEILGPRAVSLDLTRWNISNGVQETGFQGPIWSSYNNLSNGSHSANGGFLLWDGHDNMYAVRGEAPAGYLIVGGLTSDWAKYHIPTDSWIIFTSASEPPDVPPTMDYRSSPVLPYTVGSGDRMHMMFLDRKTSGFQYHRIYMLSDQRNANMHYINVDEDSGMPIGSWTSAGDLPDSNPDQAILFHNRLDRFYYYERSNEREVHTAPFKETGNLDWTLIDTNYTPGTTSTGRNNFYYLDGYASRVRTSMTDNTTYWFFGSKDHICVVTKADGIYTHCYMGAVTPYTSDKPAAKCTNHIYAGTNVQIQLDAVKGEFQIGQRMHISDVTDEGGGSFIGDIEGVERRFKPTEKFQIIDVDPGVSITADQINNRYFPGSRVAFDPQPVGITFEGLDKMQMLNSINTFNPNGGNDMSLNINKLSTVDDTVVNASGGDARRDLYALWPVVVLRNENYDTALSGTEARGSLIGVFAASGTGTLAAEDTISVGGNTYIVLNVTSSKTFKYVFGPINT